LFVFLNMLFLRPGLFSPSFYEKGFLFPVKKIIRLVRNLPFLLHFIGIVIFSPSLSQNKKGYDKVLPIISTSETVANDYIGVYQRYIGGIRGHECPMYPSCSNFGLKVFNERNFLAGFVQTSDRLLRCGHDFNNYDLTLAKNGFKYIDYPSYDIPPSSLKYRKNAYYFAFSDSKRDSASLKFVKHLMNNQMFNQALLELERMEFLDGANSIEIYINKLICLKALGEYERVLFDFEVSCPNEFKGNAEVLYHVAHTHFLLGNYSLSNQVIDSATLECNDCTILPKYFLLSGLNSSQLFDWTQAGIQYKKLADFEDYSIIAKSNFEWVQKGAQLKDKSPTTAGILSMVPGMGYAYTGHKQTAISALVINGLLTYATISNVNTKNHGMAALTGVFNLSFYIGSIYGGVNSAKRYNQQQRQQIINKILYNSNL
jgi:putative component of membrane protein insertase Oxa1/YidC/SpoIIIJ protein YidD